MINIRPSLPADGERVVDIWRAAVDATHDFLSPQDRRAIEEEVRDFLPHAPFWVATDEAGRVIAFMLLSDARMEALFVDPSGVEPASDARWSRSRWSVIRR